MRLAFSWPITYWPSMSKISCGVGRSDLGPVTISTLEASSRIMSLHKSIHSSQIKTDGPAISFLTSCWLLPQNEQYSSFSPLEDFLSDMEKIWKEVFSILLVNSSDVTSLRNKLAIAPLLQNSNKTKRPGVSRQGVS